MYLVGWLLCIEKKNTETVSVEKHGHENKLTHEQRLAVLMEKSLSLL